MHLIGSNADRGETEMYSFALIERYVKLPELLDRVEGDLELLAELLRLFLDDLPENRDALLKAIEGDDLGGAAIAAHKLKGMLANLSAIQMASLASEIELAARSGDLDKIKPLLPILEVEVDGVSTALNAFLMSVQA